MSHEEKEALKDYLCLSKNPDFDEVKEHVLERLYHSKAQFVILPFQDIFGFGEEHRINFPGTFGDHNWSWRMPFTIEDLNNLPSDDGMEKSADFIKKLSSISGRCGIALEELDHKISILPVAGTVQQRKSGEQFNIWIMSGVKHDTIHLLSDISANEEIEATPCADLPDKGHLYRAELSAQKRGNYSITVKADGKILYIPYILKVK